MLNKLRMKCVKLKLDYLVWGNGEGVSVVVFLCIGLIILIGVLVIFYKYCDMVVVKVFNWELLFVYLICIVVIFIILFIIIGKLIVVSCVVLLLLFGIFFIFCIVIMLLKID